MGKDIAVQSSASLRQSQLDFIDKYRVGRRHGFRTRSEYLQYLVDKDIKYNKFESLTELLSMLVLPMMGFFFFMLLAILTRGTLFYLFMTIFGIFAVFFSMIHYRKHNIKRRRRKSG